MEEKCVADEAEEVSGESLPSIQTWLHRLHPSISAERGSIVVERGSIVVAPTIVGSSVGDINISITQGCVHPSKEAPNHDAAAAADADADSCESQDNRLAECRQKLRAALKRKFSHLTEGMATEAKKVPLEKIYTELYITEGGCAEVNTEHEVRQIEATSRTHAAQEKSIHLSQLFAPPPGRQQQARTVITRGVAGIGKTMSVHKFCLDWAEERANANLELVFPLSFRELNLMRKKTFSLAELLCVFFPDTKDAGIFTCGQSKMLFVLDGLDESRLSLDFRKSEIVSDATQPTTIAVLLTNLIRGRLLPSSLVWITSRPAASGQIPMEHVDLVTEVRGFDNQQKDQYFRKNIADEGLANRVIAHVKSCRSLHIMCHIPVFCRMAASVLERQLAAATGGGDTPKTLTNMYIHYVSLYLENMKKRLPGRRESNSACVRANLLSLGQLAFGELRKGNLIFYESDLAVSGINVTQASMFSGVYTQIFSKELLLCDEKMFCFVHLSLQEFFAALFVFLTFHNDNVNVLVKKASASRRFLFRDSSELCLYKDAVEMASRCQNGHFDIFLRFLLGLSLESSQILLKHLMTGNRTNRRTRAEIIKHIKERIRSSPSPDRCLNLFHCLGELMDLSLVEEIQSYLTSGGLHRARLAPAQWATLVFVLLTSEEELDVFELSSYTRSEEGLVRLLPVVKTAQVANLNACNLTATCCEILANCVSSSRIRELDVSHNPLTDPGVTLLCGGLSDSRVETLRLRSCGLTELSAGALTSILGSASCQLQVLDLTDNDVQDVGVARLSDGLGSPHCKLEVLILSLCRVTEEGCAFLASALNCSRLRELDLSYNHPGDLGLRLLSALRDDPQCSLRELSVDECGESRILPGPKKYAVKLSLDPDTAHQDLSLSEGDTRATRWTKQPCPDRPERFDFWRQVLCREALRGRCYWETERSGRASLGVAYGRMCRKGEGSDSWLGRNESSWGLSCTDDGYRAVHGGASTALSVPPGSRRVGVLLDWSAGTLSFYQVSRGSLDLLHTFHTTFTEPVLPGFQLAWVDSSITLC